jgi:hypothetical protein
MTPKGYIGTLEDKSTVYHDGQNVYRAAFGNVADCTTGYLIGRWECSVQQWNTFRHTIFNLPRVSA